MGTPWPAWAWAYWAGATVVALVGVGVLLWALWRDKGYKTRRCGKCWYEMTGVPGLVCPECGRAAKSEKALFRRRRSRWWALAGIVLLVLSGGLGAWPKVERDGWWTITPDTVLIAMWPEWAPAAPPPPARNALMPVRAMPAPRPAARAAILERLSSTGLWSWQKRWLGNRCLRVLAGNGPVQDELDALALLSTHMRCSEDMRPTLLQAITRQIASPAVTPLSTYVAWRSTLPRLLERLSAGADDRVVLDRAAAEASRTGRPLVREYLALLGEGKIDSRGLDALSTLVMGRLSLLPDRVIERLADRDGPQIAEALARLIDVDPIRGVSNRNRRMCALLERIGRRADPYPGEAAGRIARVQHVGVSTEHRQTFIAMFYLARSCSRVGTELSFAAEGDSWTGLWNRVILAEAAGSREPIHAELRHHISQGTTSSLRLESLRIPAFLNLGEDEGLISEIEEAARGQTFFAQYAVLTLVDLGPTSAPARAAIDRLKALDDPSMNLWVGNATRSVREVNRPLE